MTQPTLLRRFSWLIVLILAAAFLVWAQWSQIRRVKYVTSIAQEEAARSPTSLTGYVGDTRELIVPEHIDDSYGWIAQTQLMLKQGTARIREIPYENAPFGRAVHEASPYRWWLGLLARIDHIISGQPLGICVERVALVADPLLQLLLLVATTVFLARIFGAAVASLFAVGLVAVFPLAAAFLPGAPDDYGLILFVALWSLLPLVVGFRKLSGSGQESASDRSVREKSARVWFSIAGVAGGIGMWLSVSTETPLLVGIGLGGCLAGWAMRPRTKETPVHSAVLPPWRCWSVVGAATLLLGYLLEYAPSHLGNWELRVVHPIYGVTWLGGGELLVGATSWLQRAKNKWTWRDALSALLGLMGLASLPVLMWKLDNTAFFAVNLQSFRLTKQMDAILAPTFSQWLGRDGLSATILATALPAVIGLAAFWLYFRKQAELFLRSAAGLLLGPTVVAAVLACLRIRWFQLLDVTLLGLWIPVTLYFFRDQSSAFKRGIWIGAVILAAGVGLFQISPVKGTGGQNVLSLAEVEGLVERDLAHWLAKHSTTQESTIVFAPPAFSSTLYYYGGLRGLSSFAWENKDGLSVALRIVISTSHEEALALLKRREVTHLIVPSWSSFFEEYTRSASVQTGEMLLAGLHRWALPTWLRPIPYQLPKIAGFDQQSVMIFEVVDDQDEPVAQSRLAEYFLEMGQVERARATGLGLKRFPADLGALVARVQVDAVAGDAADFSAILETIIKRIGSGADRFMPWDRRVSLAVALARGQRMDLARVQCQRCIAEIDEKKIRMLTPYSLFHLETLRKAFGFDVRDPRLQQVIKDLLPAEQGK